MFSTNLIPFDFYGDQLLVADEHGEIHVSIRRVCDSLGVDHSWQLQKLKSKAWACVGVITTHDTSGRHQDMAMLHIDSLPMWLATINETRVAPEVRPKLVRYQLECAQVLRDHFLRPIPPAAPPPQQHELFPELDSEDLARLTRVLAIAYRHGAITKVEVATQMRGLLIGAGFALAELSPEIEEMDEWVHRIAPLLTDDLDFITASEACASIGEPDHKKNVMRAAECLKQLGWKPVRLRRRLPGRRRLEQFRGFVRGEVN